MNLMRALDVAVDAADHLIRAGIESILTSDAELRLVTAGELGDGVLVHVETGVVTRSSPILRRSVQVKRPVVVLAGDLDTDVLSWLAAVGVVAVRPLEAVTGHWLTETVRAARASRPTVERLRISWCAGTNSTLLRTLSPADRRVLDLLASGHTTAVIAEKLFVSDSTVTRQISRIVHRMNVRNRTHAVAKALRAADELGDMARPVAADGDDRGPSRKRVC